MGGAERYHALLSIRFVLSVLVLLVATIKAEDIKTNCQPGNHSVSLKNPVKAPEKFIVEWTTSVDTTAADNRIIIEVTRAWSPHGADRFYQLVMDNFYNCATFFRVVPGFVVQFGLAAEPHETAKWKHNIPDDPKSSQSNSPGTLSFAMRGPKTRTSQVFVNLENNSGLDNQGFTPFARVVKGLDIFTKVYNPTPTDSGGVSQGKLTKKGNQWVLEQYPNIDMILTTEIHEGSWEEAKDNKSNPSKSKSSEAEANGDEEDDASEPKNADNSAEVISKADIRPSTKTLVIAIAASETFLLGVIFCLRA